MDRCRCSWIPAFAGMTNKGKNQSRFGVPRLLLPDLTETCRLALAPAERLVEEARLALAYDLAPGGRVDAAALDRAPYAAPGVALYATYAEALRHALASAEPLDATVP